ncbi:MAG: anion permease [Alphaproteobacteria bacterium]|nr:anion permease [Alphaproteobacteria bacterium]
MVETQASDSNSEPVGGAGERDYKETLAKDLDKIVRIEEATSTLARRALKLGLSVLFLIAVLLGLTLITGGAERSLFVIVAGVIGGYMAINIGANDVANNMGPAVGSRVLTMGGALVIAAVCEAAGAILAGGDVVKTVSKGIIDPTLMADADVFILAMMAALLAAALWINLATYIGAPVSTTHSIVGGVMGAGLAAAGFAIVNWPTMAKIAASWVLSPLLGGVIAAIFLAFIKDRIIYQHDKIAAARRWVPVLVALMAGVFSACLMMKGLKRVWRPEPFIVVAVGAVVFAIVFWVMKPLIRRRSEGMENRNKSLRTLFAIPLICSAALLSFAHGANDVANAVGPLAAIVDVTGSGTVSAKVDVPIWVMIVGAAGIAVGLALFGPRLIVMVGEQITKMNPMRAYCVALSAGITVIIASALGLPVSSTHIAVGAVFGVGFFREYYTARRKHINHGLYSNRRPAKRPDDRSQPVEAARRRRLVRRSHLLTIVAAWLITVPATALLAAVVFLVLSLLPAF